MTEPERGNAFLYVLIAIVLFAGLTFVLSRTGGQKDASSDLAEGQATIDANTILSYAASAANTVSQLDLGGIAADQLDFTLPSDAAFNTPPLGKKFFHPSGGGLNYKALPATAVASSGGGLAPGYYIGRFNNVEWTPTTAQDVIFVAHEISQKVCAAINTKITGSETIPAIGGGSTIEDVLIDDSLHGGSNADFMVANCAACEEKPALCVSGGARTIYTFYSLLVVE